MRTYGLSPRHVSHTRGNSVSSHYRPDRRRVAAIRESRAVIDEDTEPSADHLRTHVVAHSPADALESAERADNASAYARADNARTDHTVADHDDADHPPSDNARTDHTVADHDDAD